MLITTTQAVTQYGHVVGADVLAAAILDRLLRRSHTLVVTGGAIESGGRRPAWRRMDLGRDDRG